MEQTNGNGMGTTMLVQPSGYGYGNGGGFFGGDWAWIILLLLIGGNGWGFGGMGGGMMPWMMGGAMNGFGLDYLYPWLNNSQHISDGFRDQQLNTQIGDLRSDVNRGFGDVQLNMATLRESQTAQNAFIQQGFSNEVDALYNRLSSCPVPSTPVFGRTPIFTCNGQNVGCGCGGNTFMN